MEKDYQKYDAVQLAEERSFIAWVFNQSDKDRRFWEAWIKKHPENESIVQEAKQIIQSLQFKQEEINENRIDNLWNKIDQATEEEKSPKIIPLRLWLSYAAAAILLLATSFYFLFSKSNSTISTQKGEWLTHTLPDNSEVYLNAASNIEHDNSWDTERMVKLSGEAFFDVEKGERFTVVTDFGKVEVLGTSFNIFARDDQFYVTCFSGKVRVTSKIGRPVELEKGQSARFNRGRLLVYEDEKEDHPNWQDGEFSYRSTPLEEVFKELERQFDLQINTNAIELNRSYNGFFSRNSVDSALYNVTFPMGLKAKRDGKKVIITELK